MSAFREVLVKLAEVARDGFREALLRVALIVGAVLVVRGVDLISHAAAYVVGGVLVCVLAILFFAEDA